ncbi:MAG TPA: geranylgeranyl reductase family protein [Methanotrichaceae archaeon]|nr:geranylgeranyl reductase family protein [Methanotrichaceae archaeon]
MRADDLDADILIVGAGPAGSTAAIAAASAGASVAVVDRKNEIGSPVQCGGFLPEPGELRELMPRVVLPEPLLDIPERCILHRTRLQRMYGPSGQSKEFSVLGRVLDRRAFDRVLAARAARVGARIMPGTRAALGHDEVQLRGHWSGSVNPKVIIGADGTSSTVARSIGAWSKSELGLCLEYEMAGVDIDPSAAEMYFGTRYAPGGYAWIIPLGQDIANVGIGIRVSYLPRGLHLRQVLDGFINDHPLAKEKLRRGQVTSIIHGSVPSGGLPARILSGKIILAGDAAGQVMATSGGGIPLAVVAGQAAGEVAAGYILGKNGLDDYPSRIARAFGPQLERSVQIRRLVDVAMKSDRMIDAVLAMLEPDQLKSVMRGRIPDALKMLRDRISNP